MSIGKVYLIGSGPGDPGLLTVKGQRCIEHADIIVFDRLVDDRILSHARDGAELIDVGKIPGEMGRTQADISRLLVEKARLGNTVVRLKGGDPFVFGRGGEEAEVLHEAGVSFEIVPGISSSIAAPAYAGIPLTHRNFSSSFTVVTGNEDPTKADNAIDWPSLAKSKGTIVVLMGSQNLSIIVQQLVENGRSPNTPVALVQWGTEPFQTTVTGVLSDISEIAKESGISSPMVAVIGEVVNLRDKIRWFDNRPLFGKKVLVTRTRTQAGALSSLLLEKGAQPVELPSIVINELEDHSELDEALGNLEHYDWAIFTSSNASRIVFKRLDTLGLDSRAFHGTKICAIGPATAASLGERGIAADFVPDSFVSEAIVDGIKTHELAGKRVLLPRADIARKALKTGLLELDAIVDEIAIYQTIKPNDSSRNAEQILSNGVDVISFTSSSTVTNLVEIINGRSELFSDAKIACIGPITARTARDLGIEVDIVAVDYTIRGLVKSIESYFTVKDQP